MKNSELRQLIFNQIKSLGYKPYNITYPDGYFVFDMGEDSVTHFYLKGHGMWKHWKFGLWVNAEHMSDEAIADMKEKRETGEIKYGDEPKVISLFAQYDTQIDKFKPSRSALCVEYDAEDITDFLKNGNKYLFSELESMLRMMCKHPLMCYEEFCGHYAGYYSGSFLWNFIKYESKDKWRKAKKVLLTAYWLPWTKFKCWVASKDSCIHELKLEDFEKEYPGWSTSHLYEVQYIFTEEATQEQECAWMNKWWHRDDYGKVGYYDYVVHVDCCRKVGYDGRYSYS